MLFSPFTLRDVTFRNRIGVSPMCQYSADAGRANDWHFVHLGSRAVGGAGVVIFEATAVEARGRISPADLGLWEDAQIEPLARIVRFVEGQGAVACLQLAHAGRKASTWPPWQNGGSAITLEQGGWPVVSASPLPFADGSPMPEALSETGIHEIVRAFAAAARRARAAGFRAIELHAAHGYLVHQFLSPLANHRQDRYGGSFANRTRLARETLAALRAEWPEQLPLFVRLSAMDWADGGWDMEQTVELARALKAQGADLIDVSSGGLVPNPNVKPAPGYQTGFAARVRREAGVPTAGVGLITSAKQADEVLRAQQSDLVLLARELLRDPYFPLHAAEELGVDLPWPPQYLRGKP